MYYIEGGTVVTSKEDFARVLNSWLQHDERETVIGSPGTFGGRALIHVHLGAERLHLNGDTRDEGVRAYLELVRQHGTQLSWHVVANQSGKVNKVVFGKPKASIPYFYLYADDEASAPYSV